MAYSLTLNRLRSGGMGSMGFVSQLNPKRIFQYGQEYIDKKLKRFKPNKKKGALVCKNCGVFQIGGRWTWDARPLFPKKIVCPACQQGLESRPAGVLVLDGDKYRKHLIDITALMKHFEIVEKRVHPLSRIMDISTQGKLITVRTTSTKIVQSLADMVQRSFGATTIRRDVDACGAVTIEMVE